MVSNIRCFPVMYHGHKSVDNVTHTQACKCKLWPFIPLETLNGKVVLFVWSDHWLCTVKERVF